MAPPEQVLTTEIHDLPVFGNVREPLQQERLGEVGSELTVVLLEKSFLEAKEV